MDMMRKETQSREQEIQQIGRSVFSLQLMHSQERSGACPDFQGSEPARHWAGYDCRSYWLQHGSGCDQSQGGSAAGCEGGRAQEVLPSLLHHLCAYLHYCRLYYSQGAAGKGSGRIRKPHWLGFVARLFVWRIWNEYPFYLLLRGTHERRRLAVGGNWLRNLFHFFPYSFSLWVLVRRTIHNPHIQNLFYRLSTSMFQSPETKFSREWTSRFTQEKPTFSLDRMAPARALSSKPLWDLGRNCYFHIHSPSECVVTEGQILFLGKDVTNLPVFLSCYPLTNRSRTVRLWAWACSSRILPRLMGFRWRRSLAMPFQIIPRNVFFILEIEWCNRHWIYQPNHHDDGLSGAWPQRRFFRRWA